MTASIKVFSVLILLSLGLTAQETINENYKNNFSIKPFNANAIGLGLGMQYERYLHSSRKFSLVFPIDFSIKLTETNWNNDQFGINANPGVRLYFKEPRTFNWYIGMSLILGQSNETQWMYDPVNVPIKISNNRLQFGTYVNFGFKGSIAKRFTYNLELGNGIRLIDKYRTTVDGLPESSFNPNGSKYILGLCAGIGYNF